MCLSRCFCAHLSFCPDSIHSRLYPSCEWESKQIRRLIGDGKLAARLKGADSYMSKSDRECPICFLHYSQTNQTVCCNATVCTECYLQIKPQKDKHTTCPFCNNPKMTITVQQAMDEEDILKRDQEEQRVIEASIRNRAAQKNGESAGRSSANTPENEQQEGGGTFGSSLENYNRSRTFSNASSSNMSASSEPGTPNTDDSNALLSVAMTPEDRRALETEMRAQLLHETHQRMQTEEEEASMRRAEEWYGSEAGARARMRDARLAELSNLLARMSARSDNNDGDGSEGGSMGRGRGGAATLGSLIRAMESTYGTNQRNPTGRGATMEDLMRLEAAFLLGMDGDTRRQRNLNRTGTSSRSDNNDGEDGLAAGFGYSARSSGAFGGPPRRVQVRGSGGRGISSTHLDTAELYMRGVSEEEQLAMAIAMSMQDQQQTQNTVQNEGGQEASTNNNTAETNEDPDENQSSHVTEESEEEESSSESSGESEEEESVGENGNNNVNVNEPVSNNNDDADAVSLDEDEEEVVFTS